jgi:hypothetical protein
MYVWLVGLILVGLVLGAAFVIGVTKFVAFCTDQILRLLGRYSLYPVNPPTA